MTAGPQTACSLHEICKSAREQPVAAALCQASRVRSAPVIVMRTANAVGLYGPPGFKSPILRFLSSGSTLTFIAGRPLFRAFQAPCVASAWPRPICGLLLALSSPAVTRGSQSCPDSDLGHPRKPNGQPPVFVHRGWP
jgi:hypothetical protein